MSSIEEDVLPQFIQIMAPTRSRIERDSTCLQFHSQSGHHQNLHPDLTHFVEVFPAQPSHHEGLWEAGVREMKQALAKIIGSQKLTFEELAIALSHVEATLDCRPITTLDSLPDDGIPVLTPAHFHGRPS